METSNSQRQIRICLAAASATRRLEITRAVAPLSWNVETPEHLRAPENRRNAEEETLVLLDWTAASHRDCSFVQAIGDASQTPTVVFAQDAPDSEVALLFEAGVSDVVREPLGSPLFLARCSAAARRCISMKRNDELGTHLSIAPDRSPLIVGPICVDVTARRTTVAERIVHLTRSEFLILTRLAETPGVPVSDLELVTEVLRESFRAETSIARVHVHRTRQKLGSHGRLLQNVRPRAYRLVDEA